MSEPSEPDAPEEDEANSTPPEAQPRPKKKKRRKKRPSKDEPANDEPTNDEAEADDEAAEDPPDALLPGAGTPEGERLRQAHRDFEVGDYAAVRAHTRALQDAEDPEVAAAARALRVKVEVDPIQIVVLTCCAAVVAAIAYVWIL